MAWRKRIWRCYEPACPVGTFTESHALAAPRARLTRRAVVWAADALAEDDTTVAALARRLDVDWHTLWEPLKAEVQRRVADPARLEGARCDRSQNERLMDGQSTSTFVLQHFRALLRTPFK